MFTVFKRLDRNMHNLPSNCTKSCQKREKSSKLMRILKKVLHPLKLCQSTKTPRFSNKYRIKFYFFSRHFLGCASASFLGFQWFLWKNNFSLFSFFGLLLMHLAWHSSSLSKNQLYFMYIWRTCIHHIALCCILWKVF